MLDEERANKAKSVNRVDVFFMELFFEFGHLRSSSGLHAHAIRGAASSCAPD